VSDLGTLLSDTAALHVRLVRVGVESEKERLYPLFAKIYAAYDAAIKQGAEVPPLLVAAIAVAQASTGPIRTTASKAAAFSYAPHRDGAGDIGPGGTALRPGS
jgi:hypothetical protein